MDAKDFNSILLYALDFIDVFAWEWLQLKLKIDSEYPKSPKVIILSKLKNMPEVDKFIDALTVYSIGDTCCQEYLKVRIRIRKKGIHPIGIIINSFPSVYISKDNLHLVHARMSNRLTHIINIVDYKENEKIMHVSEMPSSAHTTSGLEYSNTLQRGSNLFQSVIPIFLFQRIDPSWTEMMKLNL